MSNFFIFDHVESENRPYLPEIDKRQSKFVTCLKVSKNLLENQLKVEKMLGAHQLVFAFDCFLQYCVSPKTSDFEYQGHLFDRYFS